MGGSAQLRQLPASSSLSLLLLAEAQPACLQSCLAVPLPATAGTGNCLREAARGERLCPNLLQAPSQSTTHSPSPAPCQHRTNRTLNRTFSADQKCHFIELASW
ncbi:unnamed protein product [Lepidochelys olivacea]